MFEQTTLLSQASSDRAGGTASAAVKTSHKLPDCQGPSAPRAKAHSILILESEKTEAEAGKVTQQIKAPVT